MNKQEFVTKLSDYCELENEGFTLETHLKSIPGYDSLAVLSVIAFIDEHFNLSLTAAQLRDITDFNSLTALIGEDKFDSE